MEHRELVGQHLSRRDAARDLRRRLFRPRERHAPKPAPHLAQRQSPAARGSGRAPAAPVRVALLPHPSLRAREARCGPRVGCTYPRRSARCVAVVCTPMHRSATESRLRGSSVHPVQPLTRGRTSQSSAQARTGKVPKPRTGAGTALKRKPVGGSAPRLVRCSQTGIPAASRPECAGRCPSEVPSMFTLSIPTSATPASTSAATASAARYGCSGAP